MSRLCIGLLLCLLVLAVLPDNEARNWMQQAQQGFSSSARQGKHIDAAGPDDSVRPEADDIWDGNITAHYAVIIAGSQGWWNYRHQADACHAYSVLLTGGLNPHRIITMLYDDIAQDPNNPMPGMIVNRPGGPDVYLGGKMIDYRGDDVNAANFLSVLTGDAKAMRKIGSGKVVASGPNDRVFVFFSDHGGPGVLGMPSGPFLYADQLMEALQRKQAAGGFKEMTLYIEACESGSMFEGLLPSDINVYVATASNAFESSWGTYCPGMEPEPPTGFDTCLGDLFSVAWMEDSELEDSQQETLQLQFKIVELRTSDNFTYSMGSHAMQYGALDIQSEHTSSYIGPHNGVAPSTLALTGPNPHLSLHNRHHVKQRDADLVPLRVRLARAKTLAQREAAQAALDAAESWRRAVDESMELAVATLLAAPATGHKLLTRMGWNGLQGGIKHTSELLKVAHRLVWASPRVAQGQPLIQAPGTWDCLRGMAAAWETECGQSSALHQQYLMQHTGLFASLCNSGVQAVEFSQALRDPAGGCSTGRALSVGSLAVQR
mmetsp:Transcript_3876/g.6417  ORF Transcript_3876/g.6417 Transcript_3876/m.6417 type:complete len:547 (+) Transcript_3876:79-1719(+)